MGKKMGFFQKIFQRKKKQEEISIDTSSIGQEIVLKAGVYETPEERANFLKNCCDIMKEAKKQQFEAKKEYEVVTSYLADIQKIDLLPERTKKSIEEMARKLTFLNEERDKVQKIPAKITMSQRMALEPYEDTILDEIKKMEESEQYLERINSDIRLLESEKASLDFEMEDVMERDTSGRKMLMIAGGFIAVFLTFLLILQETTEKQVEIPFLLTIAFGILVTASFYFSNRKNQHDLKVAQAKVNKVIMLLNKVKIKYVNCTTLLDYLYEKFHVRSSTELKYHWNEYMRLVEEERRFKKMADSIDFYTKEIVTELKTHGIIDAGVWSHQIEALVDPREMVEVRHRLNVRRQKLRQRIDYNNNQEDLVKKTIRTFRERHLEYDSETLKTLKQNGIEI